MILQIYLLHLFPFSIVNEGSSIVFYFTLYSFLGWLLENTYNFFTKGKFFKEGFWIGPFKPMYGFAPILLLLFVTSETSLATIIFLCFFIPSLVEYISGFLLYKLFQKRWWDYSNSFLHLQGHVCITFSFYWLVLAYITIEWIHPIVATIYESIEMYWLWIYPLFMAYFLFEFIFAIKRHLPESIFSNKKVNPIH